MSDQALKSPGDFFRRRKLMFLAFYLVLIALTVVAALVSNYDFLQSLRSFPKAVVWVAANFVPDAAAFQRLPDIARKLLDTILAAVMAAVCAAVTSFLFAILGSKTTRVSPILSAVSRGIASVHRNIPIVAWAMIFLMSFGQSNFTGFLALYFASFGFLTRAFMETIDETAKSSVEALRATGATYSQTIFQAVLPSTLPQLVSWTLYMVDTNIRDATLVGILTGTGIGFAFDLYYKSLNYRSAFMVVILVVAAVLIIETISNAVRRVIL